MDCNHKYVSVGTKRFCVRCGALYEEKPTAKKKTPQRAKKQVKTEQSADISSTDVK